MTESVRKPEVAMEVAMAAQWLNADAPEAPQPPKAPDSTPNSTPAPDTHHDDAQREDSRGGTATKTAPTKPRPRIDQLPPYRVLLHNDEHNDMIYVVETIMELTPLQKTRAVEAMLEAHTGGVSLLLVTHQERAELYRDQFRSKRLQVSIEPAQ